MTELVPDVPPVDGDRLAELPRNALKPGEEDDHDIADGPEAHEYEARDHLVRARDPPLGRQPDLLEDDVEQPVALVVQPEPHGGADHDGDQRRDVEDRAIGPDSPDPGCQQECQAEGDDELQRHAQQGVLHGDDDGLKEQRIFCEHRDEVPQAQELRRADHVPAPRAGNEADPQGKGHPDGQAERERQDENPAPESLVPLHGALSCHVPRGPFRGRPGRAVASGSSSTLSCRRPAAIRTSGSRRPPW